MGLFDKLFGKKQQQETTKQNSRKASRLHSAGHTQAQAVRRHPAAPGSAAAAGAVHAGASGGSWRAGGPGPGAP